MPENVVQLRENGPIVIQMPAKVLDYLGNEFVIPPGKPAVALCRCGQTGNRPFCDGSHKRVGFLAPETAGPKPASTETAAGPAGS